MYSDKLFNACFYEQMFFEIFVAKGEKCKNKDLI